MAAVAEREGALARVGGALPSPAPAARREGPAGHLVFAHELALADFARHLSLSARRRTADAYLDVMQRLVALEVDPLQVERGDLERFLSRNRRGRWGDTEGTLSSSTQTAELAALRRFFRWARSESLRPDDPTEGMRPPRREPYARARGLSAEEVARLLAAIPVESAAGLRLRALVLAYLLTGRRRSEVLNLRWRDLDLEGGSTATPARAARSGSGRCHLRSGWRFWSTPRRPAWSGGRRRPSSPAAGGTSRWTASTSASSCARQPSWPGSHWSGPCTPCVTATPAPCAGWRRRWRPCRPPSITPTWPPPPSICASWRARKIPGG